MASVVRNSGLAGDPSAESTEFVIWRQSRTTPVLPAVSHETDYFNDSEHILSQLSEVEREAAEESLSAYLRPVALYNLILDRASRNPSFLTRCLRYKVEEKNKRKVQLSVSISRLGDDELQTVSLFPLYVLLARPVRTPNGEALQSSCYRFKRACKVTAFDGALTMASPQAKFVLHEINKLSAEFKPGSLAVLLVSFANQTEIDLTEVQRVSPSKEGYCLMGKTPVDFVHFSKENSPDISLGEKARLMSTVILRSCYIKLSCSNGEKFVTFQFQPNSDDVQVPIAITAQELWAKDIPLLDLNSTDNPPEVVRRRAGKVVFVYKYYDNKLQRTEVKEDYTCPFCDLKHASFKELQNHLPASYDLFNFQFLDEGDHQFVVISAKIMSSSFEIVREKLHTREKRFFFCQRPTRRMQSTIQNQNANHARPLVNMPGGSEPLDCGLHNPTAASVAGEPSVAAADDDDVADAADVMFSVPEPASTSAPRLSIPPTTVPRSARTRRSSKRPITSFQFYAGSEPMDWELYRPTAAGESSAAADAVDGIFSVPESPSISAAGPSVAPTTVPRSAISRGSSRRDNARNQSRLEGRLFVHSQTAQPMSLAEVYAEADSEDEVDDVVAAIEDRRNLNQFSSATEHQKRMMHMWNMFKKKQRVLADGHMPWACEAFTTQHKEDFDQSPELLMCWNEFMNMLNGIGLLDANTLDRCRSILNS